MDAGSWAVVISICSVVMGGLVTIAVKYFTDKRISQLSERLLHTELSEKKCQEEREHYSMKLLASMEREKVLREVLPVEMITGIKTLVSEAAVQTCHLADLAVKARNLDKLDKWDSDPMKRTKDIEEIKRMAMEQGHKIEHIEYLLANREPKPQILPG